MRLAKWIFSSCLFLAIFFLSSNTKIFAVTHVPHCFGAAGNVTVHGTPSSSIKVWCPHDNGIDPRTNQPYVCQGDNDKSGETDFSYGLTKCSCFDHSGEGQGDPGCLHIDVPSGCTAQPIGEELNACGQNDTKDLSRDYVVTCNGAAPSPAPACGSPCSNADTNSPNKDCTNVKDCSVCTNGTCQAPPTAPPASSVTDTPVPEAPTDTPAAESTPTPYVCTPGQTPCSCAENSSCATCNNGACSAGVCNTCAPVSTPTPSPTPYVCTPGQTPCSCAENSSCATCNSGACSAGVCTSCGVTPTPSPSPVCGQVCNTNNENKDCATFNGCQVCVNGKCQGPTGTPVITPTPTAVPNAAKCTCAGLNASAFIAGQDTQVTAYATTTDAKQKTIKQFGFSLIGGKIGQGKAVVVQATQVPGDPNKFSASWSVNIPANLTTGTVYQIVAVPQCAPTNQHAMNTDASQVVLAATTGPKQNFLQRFFSFLAGLFTGNSPSQQQPVGQVNTVKPLNSSSQAVQVYSFPQAKVVDRGCTYWAFQFDNANSSGDNR